MSDELAMEVGRARSDAEHALSRAETANKSIHNLRGEWTPKIVEVQHDVADHEARITQQEHEMAHQQSATQELGAAVRALTDKLPALRTPVDQWREATPKKKAGFIAAVVAVLYSPELIKELAAALGKLVIDIGPQLLKMLH